MKIHHLKSIQIISVCVMLLALVLILSFAILVYLSKSGYTISPIVKAESICSEDPAVGTYRTFDDFYYITTENTYGPFSKKKKIYFRNADGRVDVFLCFKDRVSSDRIIIGQYEDSLAVFTGNSLFLLSTDGEIQDDISVDLDFSAFSDEQYYYSSGIRAAKLKEIDHMLYVVLSTDVGCRIYPQSGPAERMIFRDDGMSLSYSNDDPYSICYPMCVTKYGNTVTALVSEIHARKHRSIDNGSDIVAQRSLNENEFKTVFTTGKKQALIYAGKDYCILFDYREKRYKTCTYSGKLLDQSDRIDYIRSFGSYSYKLCGETIYVFNRNGHLLDKIPVAGIFQ